MSIYNALTEFLPEIKNKDFVDWIEGNKSKELIQKFEREIYLFEEKHPEYNLNHYNHILTENNLLWDENVMQKTDVSVLDGKCIMALLMGVVRAERFCGGTILSFFRSGTIEKWLLRLKEIDC